MTCRNWMHDSLANVSALDAVLPPDPKQPTTCRDHETVAAQERKNPSPASCLREPWHSTANHGEIFAEAVTRLGGARPADGRSKASFP